MSSSYETLWHVTALSNFVRGYDKYARTYSKAGVPESTFPDRFFLLRADELDIGIRKAAALLEKLALPGNRLVALRTRVLSSALRLNTRTGLGRYVESPTIPLDGVAFIEGDAPGGRLVSVAVEEACAHSLRLLQPVLRDYAHLQPRTFSVLPIALGCQASCPFCFSDASASAEQEQAELDLTQVARLAAVARARGAERFVITGGGEPGLVRQQRLCELIAVGKAELSKAVLITNGHHLARRESDPRAAALAAYASAGLGVLAVSRHHHDDDTSGRLMNLRTDVAAIATTWNVGRALWPGLRLRFTCVLQRGGVDSLSILESYVDWATALGVPELCFKELYVSTSVESVYHRHAANEWSHAHQVPLALVLEFAATHGFVEEARLPWGSPVFRGEWRGRPLRIAAYTEPSLFWERARGIARSWNLMADGRCLASLEDRASEVNVTNTS
ncbi:MAG: radical SAM protein [Planctomycetota bacterium]